MSPIIPAITISILLLLFYIGLTYWYRSYLDKIEIAKQQEKMEEHIDKYIPEEKRDEMREKLDQISSIIRETEKSLEKEIQKKVKAAKSQVSAEIDESIIIEQAEKEYLIHSADFGSAMPKTEKELKTDIKNLEESIEILESLDEEAYLSEPKKADVGTGMFYEKVTRKLQSIIEEQQLSEFKIIPIQRLKYYALDQIKYITDKDFLPILKLMKETELIRDLVEINPKLHIIVFADDQYEFSNPEKVILTFAYEKENLSLEDLLEITEWDFTYASQVLNELFSKELAVITDDIIVIEGFGSSEERSNWNTVIAHSNEQQKIKLEEKKKKEHKVKLHLQEKLKETKEVIEKPKREAKDYIIESEEELEQEEPPQIKFKKKPQVKQISELKKIRAIYEKTPEDVSEEDLKKLVSQTILGFHEKYSLLNGGIVQHEKLSEYIYKDIENASEDLINETITKLMELKMIIDKIEIKQHNFYVFKEMQLEPSEREFIAYALNKKPINKTNFIEGLNWDEEKVLAVMKKLQSKGILRIERDSIIIPGIIQKS
ncbi:MAG: hypothetical protein EU531_04360 [Promethearchaeota archaeon]|nr:MAG: hypothetical protein EU531_04360 [Candidatus Lokiarchaeota archaeon]